jgi:RNA polymerase sigma factor (sigma-70 family)
VVYSAAARTIRHHLGRDDRNAAEDAAQEALLRLVRDDYRLLRTYDPTRAALTTWLTVVARSSAVDLLRKRRGGEVRLDERLDVPAPEPDAPVEAPEIPPSLLSPRQRLILRMIYEDGMAVAEVARTLRIAAQTVRSQRHKAMEKLRGHFGVSEEKTNV